MLGKNKKMQQSSLERHLQRRKRAEENVRQEGIERHLQRRKRREEKAIERHWQS